MVTRRVSEDSYYPRLRVRSPTAQCQTSTLLVIAEAKAIPKFVKGIV